MKFSLCVLTAGLLVATTAADPFTGLNLFSKNFGTLEGINRALTTQQCSATSVGTLVDFKVVDSYGNPCAADPCPVIPGQGYALVYKIKCGYAEVSWSLPAVMNGMYKMPLTPHEQKMCSAGQDVELYFPFGIPANCPPGMYSFNLPLYGHSLLGAKSLEYCNDQNFIVGI